MLNYSSLISGHLTTLRIGRGLALIHSEAVQTRSLVTAKD